LSFAHEGVSEIFKHVLTKIKIKISTIRKDYETISALQHEFFLISIVTSQSLPITANKDL
jgi:hypothetical protein